MMECENWVMREGGKGIIIVWGLETILEGRVDG